MMPESGDYPIDAPGIEHVRCEQTRHAAVLHSLGTYPDTVGSAAILELVLSISSLPPSHLLMSEQRVDHVYVIESGVLSVATATTKGVPS
jgi:hypothetical protein